jgi:Excreted virulence factor EspC, type VII ESX diderm
MTEPTISVTPDVLRDVANQHDDIADTIATSRLASGDIHAAVATFGPISHQFKAAVADVLEDRDAALLAHDERHRAAASQLRRQANGFEGTEEENVTILRSLRSL